MKRRAIFICPLIIALVGLGIYAILSKLPNPTKSADTSVTEPVPLDADTVFVNQQLDKMTLRQKVSSLFILHTQGYDASALSTYLQTYQPSGLIFMSDNIPPSLEEMTALTTQLQTNAGLPYLFAIDGEGGVVNRLRSDDTFLSAAELKSLPPTETETAFRQRSQLLKTAGINLNFGIVADVNGNPDSFIYDRTFGGDAAQVSDHVAAAVRGADGLTLSTLKHFPGHGETSDDSHFLTPTTDTSINNWRTNDNPPFASGIDAGAEFVMFGHLIYSSVDPLPASLSAKWHRILTGTNKFYGISITDDMIMLQQTGDPAYADPVANAVSAINAGNTMLLYVIDPNSDVGNIDPNTLIDGIETAVNDGTIPIEIITNNCRKILLLRRQLVKD